MQPKIKGGYDMAITINDLTPKQLVAVYNEYAPTPVSRFENRQKGQRRLLALLATANVKPASAIAAVIDPAAAPAAPEPSPAPAPAVTGKARTLIVAACSRPEGATSAELFAATGWKFASWSHQLKLIAAQTGWTPEIRRYAGTARYFLREPAV